MPETWVLESWWRRRSLGGGLPPLACGAHVGLSGNVSGRLGSFVGAATGRPGGLGPSWSGVEPARGPPLLEAILKPPRAPWEPSRSLLGLLLGFPGGSQGPFGPSSVPLGPSRSLMRPAWAPVGLSWAVWGRSWGRLGCLLARLGRLLGRPGAVLGRLGTVLGASWPVWRLSWLAVFRARF